MKRRELLLAGGALAGAAASGGCARRHEIRIAAGTQGSVVYRLGAALAESFSRIDGVRASVVESSATRNALQTVVDGGAELAVAFSDSEGDGDVRTLVPLYELYLFMVVWEDGGIVDVTSMKGRKIGVGPVGSGTDAVALRLFQHYELSEGAVTMVNDSFRDTTNAFLKRQLDAVFLLGSSESDAVEKMLRAPGTKLLSLDDPERIAPVMDGIRSKQPFVVSHVVPKHLFGNKPDQPTGVIGVNALLVARADLDETLARELTRTVFANKVELGREVPRLRELSEHFEPNLLRFPLHPGAAQYYRRDEPPVIFKWAETISLGITVTVLGYSGVMAFAARRRQKSKGRLDLLYAEFQKIVGGYDEVHETPLDQMEDAQLQDVREKLQQLQRRAFDTLMSGGLEANSAFVVFHDYLRWELAEVERIQRERRRTA